MFALYATHYDGTVSTLTLNGTAETNYTLTVAASLRACGQSPSWLVRDVPNGMLYCSDESGNGTISAFSVPGNGIPVPGGRSPDTPWWCREYGQIW